MLLRALRLWLAITRLSDWQALLITTVAIGGQMGLVKHLSSSRVISSEGSRKALHIGTGLLFLLCWPLFSNLYSARYWAAALPALITLNFALIGLGILKDDNTVRSMARTGRASELLRGPVLYGCVFVAATIIFWRDHPAGLISLVLLCAGDGCAGLFGGGARLPWNNSKSWRGFIAFIVASFICGAIYLDLFYELSLLRSPDFFSLAIVVLVGGLVESITSSDWDNLTVFIACAVASHLLF